MNDKIEMISKLITSGIPLIYANTTDPYTALNALSKNKTLFKNDKNKKSTKRKSYILSLTTPLSELRKNEKNGFTLKPIELSNGKKKMLNATPAQQLAFFLSDKIYINSILYIIIDSDIISKSPTLVELLRNHYNGLSAVFEKTKNENEAKTDEDSVSVLDDIEAYMPDETTIKSELLKLKEATDNTNSKRIDGIAEVLSKSVVLLSPSAQIPNELSNHVVNVGALHFHLKADNLPINYTAALTANEAVGMRFMYNKYSAEDAIKLKKAIFNSTTGLEELPTTIKLEDVGGYENIKKFVKQRKKIIDDMLALKSESIKPKGLFLAGIPGSGKTLLATAIGNYWGLPSYKLKLETIYAGLVGGSEANLIRVLESLEKLAPCYALIDEADKKFAGVGDNEVAGSDVPKKIFDILLEFIAKNNNIVFAVTANRIKHIPEEFMRIGRFDKLYFMGKPKAESRVEIIKIHAKKHNLVIPDDAKTINKLIDNSEGQTGAEIEGAIKEAAIEAYVSEKELTPKMITTELTKTRRIDDKKSGIMELIEWAKYYADDAE